MALLMAIYAGGKYFYTMRVVSSGNYPGIILFLLVVLSSCYSKRYFATPDYYTKQPGELVLKNGERIRGDISVNNLIGNAVIVHSYQDKKKYTYHPHDVAAYRLDIGVFEPMLIGRELPNMYSAPMIMEKLTPDSFSIALYEAYVKLTDPNLMGNVSVQPGVEYDLEYYVHLPYDDSNVVWQLSTPILTTHLQKGLDSLFGQCPALLEKINARTPEYDIYFGVQVKANEHVVIGRLSTAAKEEKVKKIIAVFAEYQKCGMHPAHKIGKGPD